MGMQRMACLVALVVVGVFTFNVLAEMPTELQVENLTEGRPCEEPTRNGDNLYVHYTGRMHPDLGGHVFESTVNKKPIKFQLGAGRVIRGWDLGMLDMCPGARRRIIVPPSYGYDAATKPDKVPEGATVAFDVQLIHIDGPDNFSLMNKLVPAMWICFTASMGAIVWCTVAGRTKDIDPKELAMAKAKAAAAAKLKKDADAKAPKTD